MEKTKMMHRYERETGKMSTRLLSQISGVTPSFPTEDYIAWLESKANISDDAIGAFQEIIRTQCDEISALKEKAEAYDRLMSGGKKTLKEVANFLESIIAIDAYGVPRSFDKMPSVAENIRWQYDSDFGHEGIAKYLRGEPLRINIDFTGDWKDSLTLPDGWEEK